MSPRAAPPKWEKPDAALTAIFDASLAGLPDVERRKMFGQPCAFVHEHMFAGLFGQRMMIRLGEAERKRFLAEEPGSSIFSINPGMEMHEYLDVPEHVWSDPQKLHSWIERAYQYAVSLPPKVKKGKKGKKK